MPVSRENAMRMVGRPVVAHHVNGTMYQGILHKVDGRGVYIRQMQGAGQVSADKQAQAEFADNAQQQMNDVEEVFFPLFFLPWLALGALYPWGWWW